MLSNVVHHKTTFSDKVGTIWICPQVRGHILLVTLWYKVSIAKLGKEDWITHPNEAEDFFSVLNTQLNK